MYPSIEDQDPAQLADTFIEVLTRLGQLGREGREAIEAELNNSTDDSDVQEGLAQLDDVMNKAD